MRIIVKQKKSEKTERNGYSGILVAGLEQKGRKLLE
jgi:hypothetical protein